MSAYVSAKNTRHRIRCHLGTLALLLTAGGTATAHEMDAAFSLPNAGQLVADHAQFSVTHAQVSVHGSYAGQRDDVLRGDDRHGEFPLRIWYPTTDARVQTLDVSRIRAGYAAVPDAPLAGAERRPLILLAHGTGGSPETLAWLGTALAKQGAIVAAAWHPGSSGRFAYDERSILQLRDQPLDLRLMREQLLQGAWSSHIDPARVAVVGFSLGGTTAMLAAGLRVELAAFPVFCRLHDDGACRYFRPVLEQLDDAHFAATRGDSALPDLRAAVAIAPGFSEAIIARSLAGQPAPLMLLIAGQDQQLPPATHIDPVLPLLAGKVEVQRIADATHFSFMPLCAPTARAVLAESGEQFVCEDGGPRARAAIHDEAIQRISDFLRRHGVLRP